ncbi:MAG: 3-deoxy-7-phosphoheptulonate synthase [Anaerolineales bacterium]
MMIIMRARATQAQIDAVVEKVEECGLQAHLSMGSERAVIGAIGDIREIRQDRFVVLPGVDRVMPISPPYKLASREFHPQDSSFPLNGLSVTRGEVLLIAGPCAVESRSQILEAAQAVKEAGAHALRGGAFKPRTSPYSFQGLKEEGLRYLAEARELTGLPVVTEVMSPEDVPLVGRYGDVLQIGARNMQNYPLLRAVGESGRPVLLKRGMMSSIEELLLAAEHILSQGNDRVMLCERGIRTFGQETRYTADINALPVLKSLTHLPILFDPSHSTGHWEYVPAVALAGVAAGADGLLVEVHPHPGEALSDGQQSLRPERFQELVRRVKRVATAVGSELIEQREEGL